MRGRTPHAGRAGLRDQVGSGPRRRSARLGTVCVHGARLSGRRSERVQGQIPAGRAVTVPIHQASTFRFDSPEEMVDVFLGRRPGYVYSRYANPTLTQVEQKLARLEGVDRALLFSSGMAAITTTLLHLCHQGDRLVATRDLYGTTQMVLSRILSGLGIAVDIVDGQDLVAVRKAFKRRPKVFYFEAPTNPMLRVPDGPALCRAAHSAGAVTVMDSTFGTPILQRPAEWGVDLILHSGTKYLAGHSDLICGVAAGSDGLIEGLAATRRLLGGIPEPWSAFLLDRGIKTLEIRVLRVSETALELARRLEKHRKVVRVHYPGLASHPDHSRASALLDGGFGGVLSFEVPGGRKGALRFLQPLRWIQLATSLGGVESLISHPATSSHLGLTAAERRSQGIGESLLRLSVGVESVEDLWEDLRRGLSRL